MSDDKPDAPAPKTKAASPSGPDPVDQAVDAWWADNMPGSPLAVATDAYNHVHSRLDDLKRRLRSAR